MTAEAGERDPALRVPAQIGRFQERYGFPFDPFQRRACEALLDGSSVLVAAPTGAGKTVVGEFAADLAIAERGKTFYTAPIKALSNQKYSDFIATYGAERVGLLTGDNSINGNAPIVVMTTEVLRNMIYEDSDTLEGLRYVVLDEVHYLQDPYRGAVWEEILIHLPVEVRIVSLSATVSNTEEFAEWLQTIRGRTEVVIEETRPVDLVHWYMSSEDKVPMFVKDENGDPVTNPRARELDRRKRTPRGPRRGSRQRQGKKVRVPYRSDVIGSLNADGMLPAIYFIFSRKGCAAAVESCLRYGVRLTSSDERAVIREMAEERVKDLSPVELDVLGYETWFAGLLRGVAAHHAGMIPPFKEVVEELFAAGVIKAVFATETLALGINMPARTVVLESLMKFTGERHELITPGQFTQLTGRAGRRGKDPVGHAVVLLQRYTDLEEIGRLATTRSYQLRSSFVPSYNMAVNLVRNYDLGEAEHLVNSSFAQFQSDRGIVKLETTREELVAYHSTYTDRARCERGDVNEYRDLQRRLDELGSSKGSPSRVKEVSQALEGLRRGDVIDILTGKKKGRYAVVGVTKRRSERHPRVLTLTPGGSLLRFGASDLPSAPVLLGRVELPAENEMSDPTKRKRAGRDIDRLDAGVPAEPAAKEREVLEAALSSHPVADCPELGRHLHFAERAMRLEREIRSIERRISRSGGTLAGMFDQVIAVLEELDYLQGWALTRKGRLLTGVYNESDLIIVEALVGGLLDDLTPAELAAICSCFVYETRGPEGPQQVELPTSECRQVWRKLMRLWRRIKAEEEGRRLDLTRELDAGFALIAYDWASGEPLDMVVGEEDAPGDFVRSMKQLLDLLRQLHQIAPTPDLGARLGTAIGAVDRGLVAYSSLDVA